MLIFKRRHHGNNIKDMTVLVYQKAVLVLRHWGVEQCVISCNISLVIEFLLKAEVCFEVGPVLSNEFIIIIVIIYQPIFLLRARFFPQNQPGAGWNFLVGVSIPSSILQYCILHSISFEANKPRHLCPSVVQVGSEVKFKLKKWCKVEVRIILIYQPCFLIFMQNKSFLLSERKSICVFPLCIKTRCFV